MERTDRVLAIFYRALKGEKLTSADISAEYGISAKSVARYIEDIRSFLAENRELVGNSELIYNRSEKCYILQMDDFLKDSELLAVVKILIGSRAFSKADLSDIISKMKHFVAAKDRQLLDSLIAKEKHNYCQVNSDCESVIDNLWRIAGHIRSRNEITITYYKMSREKVVHRIRPLSIMFSEYYFYLIAYKADDDNYSPVYFRVDRIADIEEHRKKFTVDKKYDFNEGELRKKILLMFPGKCRTVRFEFSGPSLQAILDKLPTARVIEAKGSTSLIEADVYGTGIMMFLLSQGSWVKVISPDDFVEEFKNELDKMRAMYT